MTRRTPARKLSRRPAAGARRGPRLTRAEIADAGRLVEEMQERRLDVMQAVQRLRESWARVRDWDQQLAEAQAALAEAHSRFSEFYDFVPTPFLVLDDRLRILQINAAGSAFLDGVGRFTGQPFVAYVGQEDLHRLMTALRNANVGDLKRLELRVRSGEGWVPAQLTAKVSQSPRAAGTGAAPRLYYVALLDLGEVRRLEQEQRRSADSERAALAAARAKDEFIAMLSHELRTPLTPILAAADALRDVELSDAVREAVAVIRRNVMTESRLVDDLLDVARLTQKRLAVESEPLSLHRLVDLVVGDWAVEATQGGIDVRLELGATRDRVVGDSGRIGQVLRNVLANARKFTKPGGRVTVRTEDAHGFVRRVRRRHGPRDDARGGLAALRAVRRGAPAVRQPRRARPRARHQPRHRRGPRRPYPRTQPGPRPRDDRRDRAADDYGGRSRPRGSPRMQPAPKTAGAPHAARRADAEPATTPAAATTAAGAPAASGGTPTPDDVAPAGRRVLLVEDHADSAETLALVLSMKGYEVSVARTVKEAQSLAPGCDLMISDISLPDGSGLELVRELQRRLPLRAIALSGYGTEEDRSRSRAAGFAEHLTKPVDIDDLLAAVRRLADSPPPLLPTL